MISLRFPKTFCHRKWATFAFCFAVLLSLSTDLAVTHAAGTVTVTASNPNGAATVGQASAALRFADGPATPPLGSGSARLTTGSGGMKPDGSGLGGRQSLFFNRYDNTKISDIDTLRFSSYKATTDYPAVTFSIRLSVDINGGALDPGDATTLIFEPVYNPTQGPVRTGVWQTWDAISAGNAVWWSAKAIPGVCATSCYYTLNRILASNPQATIYASGIQLVVGQNSAGAPWNNFDGYVDDLRVGVSGDTTTFNFENDTSTTRKVRNTNVGQTDRIYTQVDNAINAADPGDVVDIAPGTYPEQVEIDKNVKIVGAGTRTTTITPPVISTPGQPTLAPLATLNGNVLRPVIFANASQATLSTLTVDGSALGTENQKFAGIASNNADLSLDHLHITQTKSTPASSTASGYGIYAVANSGTNHTFTLNRLTVDDYQAAGIVFSGANITAAATDTTVTGSGATSTLPQQGVRFENGANGSLDRVQVAAHRCEALICGPNPFLQKAAAGVTFDQAGMVHIQDSTLTNNDVGLQATTLADGHGMVDQTVISGNHFAGLRLGSGQQMVNRSTIRSNGVGLQTVSKSTDIPVAKVFASGNTLTHNEIAFATTDDQLGDGKAGQFTAIFNRIVNNDFGFKSQSDQIAALQNNWWGCNGGINTAKCEKQQVEPSAAPAQTEPHLIFTLSADKQTLNLDNPTTALTASVRRNSAGELTAADNFPLAPVTYTTTLGALQPTNGILTSGDTRTIFNANGAIGQTLLTATLDNEQASTQLNVSGRIPAGNRDSDGDGLDDTADCAPNDAARPYQADPDLNCDGQPDSANQICDAKCKVVIRQELLLTSCRFVRVKKKGKPTKRVRRCKVRRTRLKQETRPFTTSRITVKTVRLSRKQRRAVRRARRAKIQITITRTDQSGRASVERRFITLKPKKRKKKRKTGRKTELSAQFSHERFKRPAAEFPTP